MQHVAPKPMRTFGLLVLKHKETAPRCDAVSKQFRARTLLVEQAGRRLAATLGRGRRPGRRGRCRFVAVGHEAVELVLILGSAKLANIVVELSQHLVELAALFGKPLEFLLAPVVESDVTGAGRA